MRQLHTHKYNTRLLYYKFVQGQGSEFTLQKFLKSCSPMKSLAALSIL